jgi:hypothetical protein
MQVGRTEWGAVAVGSRCLCIGAALADIPLANDGVPVSECRVRVILGRPLIVLIRGLALYSP